VKGRQLHLLRIPEPTKRQKVREALQDFAYRQAARDERRRQAKQKRDQAPSTRAVNCTLFD
jgi:hypothetical protein